MKLIDCASVLFIIIGIFSINFRFSPKVCDGCPDMTQKSMSVNNVAIVTIGENYCRFHF